MDKNETKFQFWNIEANSIKFLENFINNITNKNSNNYIPILDRIAIFDFDGTIYGEWPQFILNGGCLNIEY